MNIETALAKHERQLMQLPNVAGVGIGEKAGRSVIKVLVTRKVPERELQPSELIPKQIEEWETDVDEIGFVEAQKT